MYFKVLFFTFKAIHGIVLRYVGELVSLKEQGVYKILDLLVEHIDRASSKTRVTLA